MANGIGARILDGCSFEEFLMLTGGHLIDPVPSRPSAPNRQFRRDLKKLKRMPVGRALSLFERQAEASHSEAVRFDGDIRKSRREKLARYRSMRAKVRAWHAPKALIPVKRQMLRQISENMAYDCGPVGPAPKQRTGAEYLTWYLGFIERAARFEATDEKKRRLTHARSRKASRAMVRELDKFGKTCDPAK